MIRINDRQIDRYITTRLEERGVTPYDMIGGRFIDPDPENKMQPAHERARWNRFTCLSEELRFCELLTEGNFDPDLPYKNMAIPIKDLVRYWWKNIADQAGFLDLVFEDIFSYYTNRMLPEKEEEGVDVSDAFDSMLEAV